MPAWHSRRTSASRQSPARAPRHCRTGVRQAARWWRSWWRGRSASPSAIVSRIARNDLAEVVVEQCAVEDQRLRAVLPIAVRGVELHEAIDDALRLEELLRRALVNFPVEPAAAADQV